MPRRSLLVCVFLFLVPALSAAAQDAPSLETLQSRYDALEGLRATFTQVTASEFANDSTRIDGTVLLAGNKYRVETATQTVVRNGTTTWIYSPADSQVVVNNADAEASTLSPQTFLTTSAETYNVTSTRAATRKNALHDVLSLAAAKSSAQFEEVTIWVRRTDRIVTRLRGVDRNGSILDLRLREIEVGPRINGEPFSFSAPDGVEVVDLRSAPNNSNN